MVASLNLRRLRRWAGGINNVADQTDLQSEDRRVASYVVDAVNVDFDAKGKPARRAGTQLLLPGSWHSVWSDEGLTIGFGVQEGVLCMLRSLGGSVEQVQLAEVGGDRVSYAYINGEVYWSNAGASGIATLQGTVREWGLPDAPSPLVAATGAGGLDEGTYRVAMTFRTAQGEESGAMESSQVDVATGGGIFVNLPYIPEGVAEVVLYRTEANGDRLYQAAVVTGTTTLGAGQLGRQLETQFHERIPMGRIVRAYRGRLYVALPPPYDDTLAYTRPLRYGLYKPTEDYVRFGSPIAFVEPVDDGLYVGTRDRTFFLPGADPTKFQQTEVDLAGAVPFASLRCRGAVVGEQGVNGTVAVWWTRQGRMAVGTAGGGVLFPTQNQYASSDFDEGALGFREQDGVRRIVALLRRPGSNTGFRARDTADAVLIRNGIVVPEPTVKRAVLIDRVRVGDFADAVQS